MAVPFRIGVMQLTMEPLDEIVRHAHLMDRHGFDTMWLAEAYPWWRKHSMEARPLFLPSTIPRGALTTSELYGSTAGGS